MAVKSVYTSCKLEQDNNNFTAALIWIKSFDFRMYSRHICFVLKFSDLCESVSSSIFKRLTLR